MKAIVVALAAVALVTVMPGAASAQDPITLAPGEVLLKIEAQGVDKRRPDMMTITAGTVTTAGSAREALSRNNSLSAKLIEALRAQGIAAQDVRTSDLSVDPVMDNEEAERQHRESRIIGYVAKNTLEVRLRELNRAADVIDALFTAGANSIQGPRFSHSDPKPAQKTARQQAVAVARDQADTYAAALGMRVARVLRVSERGSFDNDSGEAIVVTGSRIARTNIEPGDLSTRITVWIDYALVPVR